MRTLFIKMFFNSFFIQTLWNFERMQNAGFLFVIKPFLDSIYKDKDERIKAYLRHLDYFNTHPYMANIIIPACANIENADLEIERKTKEIEFLKTAVAGSFAAIGDSFFWGTLRVCAAFISIAVIIFASLADAHDYPLNFVIPLIFLLGYNSFHVPMRFWFLFASFSLKEQAVSIIDKLQIKSLLNFARFFALLFIILSSLFYIFVFHFYGFTQIDFLGYSAIDGGFLILLFFFSIFLGRVNPSFKVYGLFIITALFSLRG